MASRSFRSGASGLGQLGARPTFSRASSGGSIKSSQSEDNLTGTLRSLALESPRSAAVAGTTAPRPITSDENIRKRSAPIAIELPRSSTQAYTPLTARGDLPGGYFPNHQSIEECNKPRRPSGFGSSTNIIADIAHRNHAPLDTPDIMSATSSVACSPLLSPPLLPAALMVPRGKYHPSNYQSPSQTVANTRPSTGSSATLLPNLNLTVPSTRLEKAKGRVRTAMERPEHRRQPSDVRQKLEKYQKDMIAQAKIAAGRSREKLASTSSSSSSSSSRKPSSPKLQPVGTGLASPGMITPFELEGEIESGDFMIEAERRMSATR